MKDLILDIIECLENSDMDYEMTADYFGLSPEQVYAVAKMFGDVE